MKVSVIMASFINQQRKNADKKFIRAVKSFIKQDYDNKELIIISDGCEITNKLYDEYFKTYKNITLFKSQKLQPYSGGIRSIGLKLAEGNIICYLDNDDIFTKTHISKIVQQFDINKYTWVYYDDFLLIPNTNFKKFKVRHVKPQWALIGTSTTAHINFYKDKRFNEETDFIPDWGNGKGNGYGHDWLYIQQLNSTKYSNFKKLKNRPGYIVCHYGNIDE